VLDHFGDEVEALYAEPATPVPLELHEERASQL
jgi:hypothetical protein